MQSGASMVGGHPFCEEHCINFFKGISVCALEHTVVQYIITNIYCALWSFPTLYMEGTRGVINKSYVLCRPC